MNNKVRVVRAAEALQPIQLTPPAEMRRGSVAMTAVCAGLLLIGRLFFWHGKQTGSLAATILFFVLLYTIFALVQLIFGTSINELSKNFMRATGKQKLLFVAMIVLSVGVLAVSCGVIFPGIENKGYH